MKKLLLTYIFTVVALSLFLNASGQQFISSTYGYACYNYFDDLTATGFSPSPALSSSNVIFSPPGTSALPYLATTNNGYCLTSTRQSSSGTVAFNLVTNSTYNADLNTNEWEWSFLYKCKDYSQITNVNTSGKIGNNVNGWKYWLHHVGTTISGSSKGFFVTQTNDGYLRVYVQNGGSLGLLASSLAALSNNVTYCIKVQRLKGGFWRMYLDPLSVSVPQAKTAQTTNAFASNPNPGSNGDIQNIGTLAYTNSIIECQNTVGNDAIFQWDELHMYTRYLNVALLTSPTYGISPSPLYAGQTNAILVGVQLSMRGNYHLGPEFYLNETQSGYVQSNLSAAAGPYKLYKTTSNFFSIATGTIASNNAQIYNSGVTQVGDLDDVWPAQGNSDGTLSIPGYYFLTTNVASSVTSANTLAYTTLNTLKDKETNNILPSSSLTSTATPAGTNTITFGNVYDWKGTSASFGVYPWTTGANWTGGSAPGSGDIARFGVSTTFTNPPTVSNVGTTTVSAILVGPNTISSVNTPMSIIVPAATNTLAVTNGITMLAGSNLTIAGGGTLAKGNLTTGTSSNITVASTASLSATNMSITNSGNLILLSDATGSGSIGALVNSTLTTAAAKTFVQRYVSAVRGYRLFSSAVNASNAATGNYSLAYLKNNAWITGSTGTGGGFDKTGSPTIYFFRENMAPSQGSFTSGNFRGVDSYPTAPYSFDNEATDYNIPVGNGFLFFFRGDRLLSTVLGATISSFIPTATIFTATGTINTGSITVTPWYTPGSAFLGYSTATLNATIRGYNLVGNPYPSTINWEKYNRNSTVANSSIYGSNNLPSTIYIYNTSSKQYASYQPNTNAISAVADTTSTIKPGNAVSSDGVASNMIASGQGFFIVANSTTPTTQALTFRETAKTSALPATASIVKIMSLPSKKLMGTPVATTTINDPIFRVKLAKDDINTDAVTFVLNNKNDAKFSIDEDALDIGGSGAQVSLSARSSDNVLLSINRLPLPKLTPQVLPLTVDATTTGLYSLKMDMLENMPSLYQVFLKDALKADSLDMRAYNTYNFNIDKSNAATFGDKRFTLVIRQNPDLALRLLDFNGAKVTAGAKLTWITENEANYTNFTVERSIDGGKTFDIVGGLHAAGNGTYSIVDTKPVKGLNQYRLKQDDINGTISYSKVVDLMYADVDGIAVKAFNVYPNPVSSVVNVSIINPATTATTYTIKISDGSGAIVKNAVSANASWQTNVGNLLPGTYFVQVVNNYTKAIIGNGKFVKL